MSIKFYMLRSLPVALKLTMPTGSVQRQLLYCVLSTQIAVLVVMAILGIMANWTTAVRWFIQTLILFLGMAWQVRHIITQENHLTPLKHLGLPNQVSLLRSVLIIFCGGFFGLAFLPVPLNWMPGILYAVAVILDAVDGWLARRLQEETFLGARLDTCFDALGLLVAPVVACWLQTLHPSYLLVSLAYYIFQCGLYWRRRRGLNCHALPPSTNRRTWAGLQMVLVAIALLPIFAAHLTRHLGIAFMLPVLAGFLRDWYVVTSIHSGRRMRMAITAWASIYPLLLLALRGVVLVAVVYECGDLNLNSGFQLLMIMMGVCIVFGWAGRAAAAGILLLLAFTSVEINSLKPAQLVLLYSAAGILLLGAGRWSLWRADECYMERK